MKKTLLILSFFTITILMTACSTSQVADKMAAIGSPSLSSNPCAALDEKVLQLDRFTEVVKHTSAFHLEEKANAIPTPGITVSNNRKQMLKDAEKKYAEYAQERQKYGCETSERTDITNEKLAILDACTAIDNKVITLDRFTEVVMHTSAFHLEEKANAIETPGITVSNNRKKMLKDAQKKYTEYAAAYHKHGCKNPMKTDRLHVIQEPTVDTSVSTVVESEPVKSNVPMVKEKRSSADTVQQATAVEVSKSTATVEETVKVVEKHEAKVKEEQPQPIEESELVNQAPVEEKMTASDSTVVSTNKCNELDEDFIELSEFATMVKNTSAFHLEEKARALPSPGFTVSNNKKKMLRDIEKKYTELIKKRQKYGCEPLSKE